MKLKLLTAALMAACAAPVLAGSSASASLTGLKFELVDLDLKDGVAPSVTFTGVPHVRLQPGSWCLFRGCDAFGDNIKTGVKDGSATWFGAASSSGLYAVSNVEYGGGYHQVDHSIANLTSIDNVPLFRLSAHTGLRISGNYSADGTAVVGLDEGSARSGVGFSAYSGAGRIEGGNQSISFGTTATTADQTSFHEQGTFSVLWRNDANRTVGMWGNIGVSATAGVVGAVPEPSTYALMAAGLGVVGFAARKRTKSAS